jgi:pterin-4a-carbinolamine dehydratase
MHTSAGLKMTDVQGRDPIKNKRSFIYDENSLRDLQSHNTIFLMKIILTKETKESFKQFDDVFQFFRLCSETSEAHQHDPKNLPKFHWEELQDLQPLDVTTTTDMAADWKLVGVGGGVKKTKHFCTLCPIQSADVHQPNNAHCI